MMGAHGRDAVRLIPIEQIEILNPRERNQKTFREIVASIQALGLKKPITVTPRGEGDGERWPRDPPTRCSRSWRSRACRQTGTA